MGNAAMAAGCSNSKSNVDLDGWVIQLEERLHKMKMEAPLHGTSALIFPLQKVRSYDEQYYVPRLVSIGPYHFGRPQLANMEQEKDEAVLRMERRIQRRSPERTIQSIVQSDIVPMEKTIREFYADKILCSPKVLAWAVTRDACFIYELLLNYPRCCQALERSQEELMVSVKHSSLFDGYYVSRTMQNLLVDFFIFENQIPGLILERLVEIEMGSPDAAKEKLNQMMDQLHEYLWTPLFTWGILKGYSYAYHLLEALYFTTVGGDVGLYREEAYSLEQPQGFCLSCIYGPACLKKYVGWLNGIFRCRCMQCSNWMKGFGLGFLLESRSIKELEPGLQRIPPAVDLNRAGVRFHVLRYEDTKGKGASIQWIRFDQKTATLYLPQIRISIHDHYLVRNLIALELSSEKYSPKPITQFAIFMDELIDTQADVALLVKRGVMNNMLGSNEHVAHFFNSMVQDLRYFKGCKPIDDAKLGLFKYQRRKYRILWSQFVGAYFSNPWLVAGSIGATLLLLMTVVQVFCLFYACNSRSG